MDVYFKPSYIRETNAKKGICQNTDIVFEYNGNECRIPALYLFEEGIVVDVFEKVDNNMAEKFIKKVYDKSLTEAKLKLLSTYNPFENFYIKELSVDGEKSIGAQIQKFYVYSDILQPRPSPPSARASRTRPATRASPSRPSRRSSTAA
jgi:hypothetical protein